MSWSRHAKTHALAALLAQIDDDAPPEPPQRRVRECMRDLRELAVDAASGRALVALRDISDNSILRGGELDRRVRPAHEQLWREGINADSPLDSLDDRGGCSALSSRAANGRRRRGGA